MAEKKLEEYISKLMKKGYSKGFIKEQLVKAGYNAEKVNPIINNLEEKFLPKDTSRKWHIAAAVITIVIVIIITLFFLYIEKPATICQDTECFIKAANDCRTAQYYEDVEGTKMLYEIENCKLRKRFTTYGEKEPKELQNLLANKAVECTYEKGKFNANWMEVFGNLESCAGPLKDTVYEIRIAQETLS